MSLVLDVLAPVVQTDYDAFMKAVFDEIVKLSSVWRRRTQECDSDVEVVNKRAVISLNQARDTMRELMV